MKTIFLRITIIVVVFSLLFTGILFVDASSGRAQSLQVWSDPVNLSNSGGSSDSILLVDANGVIHVIWVDQFDGYKYTKSVDGVTWTPPETVKYPFSPKDDSRPILVAGVNGVTHVFWKDKKNTLYYAQAMSGTLDNPGSWTGGKKIVDLVLDFSAVVDAQGALHLSYLESAGTNTSNSPAGIYYRKLDGAGWSATKNLYESQYFRSLGSNDAHVRLSVANNEDNSRSVYVVWDDRLQKRIFMIKSSDNGVSWEKLDQIKGPEDFTGSDMPFNINIGAVNNNVLLLWQAGEPGVRCTQYSQWSIDGGNQFAEPVKMLSEGTSCPQQSDFISQTQDFSIASLNIQDDLSLIAWNGSKWSFLQPQAELSVFLNPMTLDNVLFGCQKMSVYQNTLFIVGCDKGSGGDIWFRSRPMGSIEEWFPSPSAWTSPVEITSASQKISSLVSIADNQNNLHAFWVQAPLADINKADTTIQYSHWSDGKWSKPVSILAGFNGTPVQLSVTLDTQGKVFLSWSEGENGNLYFSWASIDRAHLPSEWSDPQQIPSPSQVSSSPEILVDSTDKIAVAYSVPVNEDRGIYVVQSDSFGKTWSPLIRVFDAVAVNWDLADQPKMTLSGDGFFYLMFSRFSLRESDPSGGLYYVQSSDGGATWSQPDIVTEVPTLWSQIVSFDKQIVHRLWQENNGLALDVFHQISRNSGKTWENSVKVFSTNDVFAKISLSKDPGGRLYLTQTHLENGSLVVDFSQWDGTRWMIQEKKEIPVKTDNIQYSTSTGITSQGVLNVLIATTYPKLKDGLENKIITFNRLLDISSEENSQTPLLIPTAVSTANIISSPDSQGTPTALSPLANINNAPSSPRKNLVGLILVGAVIIMIAIVIWPRKKTGIG